jgi:hypothetical protein
VIQSSPYNDGELLSVSCASATACAASGGRGNGGFYYPLAAVGSAWTYEYPPGNAILLGVSCTAAMACTAVGQSTTLGAPTKAVVERYS